MKLLKPADCPLSSGGGNVKERTMIVEVHGIGFRTRVRFPPGPSKNHRNFDTKIAVITFCMIICNRIFSLAMVMYYFYTIRFDTIKLVK